MTPRKDRELFHVDLIDICYVCATYCMRRVGFRGSIGALLAIAPSAFSEWDLARGDILIWKVDNECKSAAIEICGPHIITSYLAYNRHFGVYEGDGIVSDIICVGDNQIPNIRFRRLIDITHSPDGVIRLSDKEIINDVATNTPQRGE